MISLIITEFKKLKRSNMLLIIILCSILLPTFLQTIFIFSAVGFDEYVYMEIIEIIMFLLLSPILFSLLITQIFISEFIEKTVKVLFTYQYSRIKIFWSKILVFCLIVFGVFIIQYILNVAFVIYYIEGIKVDFVIKHFKMYFFSYLLLITIQPFILYISLRSKSIIIAVVISIVITGHNIILFFINTISRQQFWDPIFILTFPFNYFQEYDNNIVRTVMTALFMYIIGFYLCIRYIRKVDL